MTVVAWIIIGLIVIVAVAHMAFELLGKILGGLSNIAAEIFGAFRRTILAVLGRKNHTSPALFIPDELLSDVSPLPSRDPELTALLAWKPQEPKQFIPKKVEYTSGLIGVHPQGDARSNRMDIEDMYKLQTLSFGTQPCAICMVPLSMRARPRVF
ncbi:MAG: hypothetical protein IV108_07415, partial [Burkholderiales bacterium]|nr:hypothetical protein [Burkholderiales bacterium]